jgi:hypothetical protein
MWFMDVFGQLRPKEKDLYCLRWVGKEIDLSPECRSDFYTSYLNYKNIYKFNFDYNVNSIFVNKEFDRAYLGFSVNKPYHKMRLFGPTSKNKYLNKWQLKWVIYESQAPSAEPSSKPTLSQLPSLLPTRSPSATPSAIPSPNPTSNPSPSPSLSQMPTDEPSLLPSDEPSLLPSSPPSDEPSILHSDEVRIQPLTIKFSCSLHFNKANASSSLIAFITA